MNLLQNYAPERLPMAYRDWNFLPLYLHSLEPYDRLVQKSLNFARATCCGFCCATASQESKEIIKMKPSQSNSGSGLDNLGFIRGDQVDEMTKSTHPIGPAGVNVVVVERDEDVEQTQL